jgi:hypothetical protein
VHSGGDGVAESTLEPNSSEPSVNKWQEGCQQVGDRPLSEVGKEGRQKTTGLRPWAPNVRWLCSLEEQTANHHNTLTADGSLTLPLPQGKGVRQIHKTLVNKHRDKPTPKQDN